MDNLDFGWGFVLILMLIYGFVYYLIATVNYLLVVLLGGQIKKLVETKVAKKSNTILYTALPFFISSTIIFFTVIKLSFIPINKTGSPYNVPGGIIFWDPYLYYFTGFIGYIIGLTCLSLTRYSFTKDWAVIGRLQNKRTIFNFILWTAMAIILNFICKSLLDLFFPYWLTYPAITILATYLFLKWRNIEKQTIDK